MILKCIDCQRDLLELLETDIPNIHAIAGLEIVDFLDEDNKDIVVLKGSKDEK